MEPVRNGNVQDPWADLEMAGHLQDYGNWSDYTS